MVFADWKRLSSSTIMAVLAGLWAAGCGPANGGGEGEGEREGKAPGELVRSEKARVTSPALPEGDLAELVAGNSAFAFDLYQQVRDEDGNLFYSPHSISIALAMTYAGARDETERQMADALNFTLPQDRLHPAFNALDLELASRGQDTANDDDEGFRLNIVNRIWGQIPVELAHCVFAPQFLDVLAENYGAGLSLLDFRNALEESRLAINDWVSDQTEEKIQDLIPPGVITIDTRLVLTNAIYFNAAWSKPFDEAATRDEPFHLLDGSQATAEMMHQVETFGYAAGDGYQAVELSYEGNELSMVILLPDAGGFEEFESMLDAVLVESIVQDLSPRYLALTMPSFTFEWEGSLADVLRDMGMPAAFELSWGFSGMMNCGAPLQIQDVIHKAFVAVDEEGTEAAAATAVIIGEGEAVEPEEPLVVTIDRPFVFLIRDIETGAILFAGRVLDPTSS